MARGINDERAFGGRHGQNEEAPGVVIATRALAIAATEKGLLVRIEELPASTQISMPGMGHAPPLAVGDEHWLPKKGIHDDSEVYEKDHEGKLVVKAWLAKKEGWR